MRYVLLTFADDSAAEGFIKAVTTPGAVYFQGADGHFAHLEDVTVAALFAKPTKFCECADKGEKRAVGKKYGWTVHPQCGKPVDGTWQHARNLLDPPGTSSRERLLYLGTLEGNPERWLSYYRSRHS